MMIGTRVKSILLLSVLLIGTRAIDVTAKDPKAVAPETAGLSSERLARIDKAMQEDIDPKEDMVSLFFTQFMPMDINAVNRFQTLVYQAISD
jgi:hypothetical protein